jgi:8-oxo-dGTP diphosphatase
MKRIDVVYVLIVDEVRQRVLMVKNADNDSWTLPGGAVEPGETLVQAAVREAWEETGVRVRTGNLVSVNECFLKKDDHHVLFFTFRAYITEGEPHIERPNEITAVEWIDFSLADRYLAYHPGGVRSLLEASCPYMDQGVQ